MKARFQVQTQGRTNPPFMRLEFSEDVNLPTAVFVSGDIRTHGMIITSFKRSGSNLFEVKNKGSRLWPRHIVLSWEYIGGYSSWERIEPTNFVEMPVQPNDPVNAERWIIDPLMTRKPNPPPQIRAVPGSTIAAAAPKPMPADAPKVVVTATIKPPEDRVVQLINPDAPMFTRLRVAVRTLNDVLAEFPAEVEPVITVEGRKIRISVPLE